MTVESAHLDPNLVLLYSSVHSDGVRHLRSDRRPEVAPRSVEPARSRLAAGPGRSVSTTVSCHMKQDVVSGSRQCAAGCVDIVDRMTSTVGSRHTAIEPGILYFGTPVVLISTENEDSSANLAPMSSAFWLGWRAVLGLNARSKTTENVVRTRECVLNLPSDALAANVDQLALTTGSDPVPPVKVQRGYRFEPDKFEVARLTPLASEAVRPPRVAECPVNLEAVVEDVRSLAANDLQGAGGATYLRSAEVRSQLFEYCHAFRGHARAAVQLPT